MVKKLYKKFMKFGDKVIAQWQIPISGDGMFFDANGNPTAEVKKMVISLDYIHNSGKRTDMPDTRSDIDLYVRTYCICNDLRTKKEIAVVTNVPYDQSCNAYPVNKEDITNGKVAGIVMNAVDHEYSMLSAANNMKFNIPDNGIKDLYTRGYDFYVGNDKDKEKIDFSQVNVKKYTVLLAPTGDCCYRWIVSNFQKSALSKP